MKSSKLVLLLGFPKSGTSSFNDLFKSLKFKTYHQIFDHTHDIGAMIQSNYNQNKRLLCFLDDKKHENYSHVCITQMDSHHKLLGFFPQNTHLSQIYDENPDAIFILNVRDPLELLNSMRNWGTYDKRLLQKNPELFDNTTGTDDARTIQMINNHYTKVEKFFENKDAKFIKFDINTDKVSKLNKYIDLKTITRFPHSNKNRKKKIADLKTIVG